MPSPAELPERLDTVLQVIYWYFNEGYSASSGASLTRAEVSGEAIRLGRLLLELLPEPEVMGLLALMLLQESRRGARVSPTGDLILLNDQDRSRWNHDLIAEGKALVERAWSSRRLGHTRFRRRSRRCMPGIRRGSDGLGQDVGCTMCCCGPNRRRWWS